MYVVHKDGLSQLGLTGGYGTPLGPGAEYAFTVLWLDGSTSLEYDSDLLFL